jgi:hypothetical protein
MRLARLALAGGAMLTLGGSAGAAPAPERGISEYHTAPGCPGEFTFRAQVHARTSQLVLVPAETAGGSPSAVRFVVRLRQTAVGYAGTLEIWRAGAAAQNTLAALTCDEVVAGLSIAAALSTASPSPEPLPEPSVRVAPAPRVAESPVRELPPADPNGRWLLGASLGARFGYAPSTSLGAGVLTGRWFTPGSSSDLVWRAAANVAFSKDVSSARAGDIRLGLPGLA